MGMNQLNEYIQVIVTVFMVWQHFVFIYIQSMKSNQFGAAFSVIQRPMECERHAILSNAIVYTESSAK